MAVPPFKLDFSTLPSGQQAHKNAPIRAVHSCIVELCRNKVKQIFAASEISNAAKKVPLISQRELRRCLLEVFAFYVFTCGRTQSGHFINGEDKDQ
jgi:hypothetical protein